MRARHCDFRGLNSPSDQSSCAAVIRLFSPPQHFLPLPHGCPMPPATIPRMKTKLSVQPVKILPPNDQGVAPQVAPRGIELAAAREVAPSKGGLPTEEALPVEGSLQIKAAEYWLKLGEADQALKELEALPSGIWNNGWALKTRIPAIGVLRERDQVVVQK